MQPCGCMGCATCLQEMGTQYTYSGREAARCPVTDAEERSAGLEYMILNHEYISGLLKVREEDSYKGTYGHALVIAGSVGMMGAAILAAGGALKSGCGLVTVHVPYSERLSIHLSHPSAIVECDPGTSFSRVPGNLFRYRAAGIGCGLGQSQDSISALKALLSRLGGSCREARDSADSERETPGAVLDADALNIIASHPEMFGTIPPGSILTPHLGELSRLLSSAASYGIAGIRRDTGPDERPWNSSRDMTLMVRSLAEALGSVIVVKGPGTMVCPPDGMLYFNATGNPGMAKGGSGDILTGLVTGLRARGYSPAEAAGLGVWFHGLAGDTAAEETGMESMNASDILRNIRIR